MIAIQFADSQCMHSASLGLARPAHMLLHWKIPELLDGWPRGTQNVKSKDLDSPRSSGTCQALCIVQGQRLSPSLSVHLTHGCIRPEQAPACHLPYGWLQLWILTMHHMEQVCSAGTASKGKGLGTGADHRLGDGAQQAGFCGCLWPSCWGTASAPCPFWESAPPGMPCSNAGAVQMAPYKPL